jgi:antitoxin (DNA-binding transcriptional repressor) of toxin-antitoxin stability system
MLTVGIKVLKNKLSEYVRLAAGGETVLVTDRERVVAELVPPRPGRRADPKGWWAEQIRLGNIAAARNRATPLPPRRPIMTFDEMMADLDKARED